MPLAAAKLVKLTEGDKEETARKACLDIISLPMANGTDMPKQITDSTAELPKGFSSGMAGKLLKFLAEQSDEVLDVDQYDKGAM